MHVTFATTQNQKKKKTSNHSSKHIHPDGHQPPYHHATGKYIHHTVAANTQKPAARSRNIIQQHNHTLRTRPTDRLYEPKPHTIQTQTNNSHKNNLHTNQNPMHKPQYVAHTGRTHAHMLQREKKNTQHIHTVHT